MIQDDLISMGNNACLALCYLKAALEMKGQPAKDQTLLDNLAALYYGHIISSDCYVDSATKIFDFAGVKARVTKMEGPQVNAAKYVVANYKYGRNNHFVLFKDGRLYFNSLDHSKCVELGYITDVRVIEMA